MEETEKMTALKKAYAEIILNTAKEAAARIIVSERRAQSFQRDLLATKDEALRIMFRIKQMIDLKVKEDEIRFLIQQKRIDELEAQLHEAEDIVSNLRADSYMTQAELEKLSINQQRPLDSLSHHPEGIVKPDATNGQQNNPKNHRTSVVTCPLQPQHGQKTEWTNSVSSTVIRSTKPGLYRNSYTQRIRTRDKKLLKGHPSFCDESDDHKSRKLYVADKGRYRIDKVVPAFGEETAQNEENIPINGKETTKDGKAHLRLKRKRAMRQKRNRTRQEAVTTLVASETSGSINYSLTETSKYIKVNQDTYLERRLAVTVPSNPPATSTSETHDVSVIVTDKDLEIADALVLITQGSVPKTEIGITGSKEEQENPTSSPEKSNAQVSDPIGVISIQSPKSRIVKYIFQRKRRRESISIDDINSIPQKDIPKQTAGKEQDTYFYVGEATAEVDLMLFAT
ncbi:hypothetical protein V2J09_014990 [Rumex salicifolius]